MFFWGFNINIALYIITSDCLMGVCMNILINNVILFRKSGFHHFQHSLG